MTPAERIATELAERFDVLDAPAMAAHPVFRQAVASALGVLDESSTVAQVVALGSLAGSRDPHRVIVSRLRELPGLVADRTRLADERAEERRWAKIDRAETRGHTLRALVERGQLYRDEADEALTRELADEELRSIAVAALEGGTK